MMVNVNLPGRDYSNFWSNDPNQCRANCQRDWRCAAWTWVRRGIQGANGRCWLKTSVPPQQASDCCISAVERASATPPPSDVLGSVWDEEEVAGWRGTWRRRGRSNVFDAEWVHPNGSREYAQLSIHVNGRIVTVQRTQLRPSHPRMRCTYHGTLAADGRSVAGTYGCAWARGPYNWRATIR